jgi:hypothetical protein
MKKFLILSVVLLFSTGIAVAGTHFQQPTGTFSEPTIMDTGGPDAYGYHWEDNDGGGSLPYSWIDISSRGVAVTGLTDDNFVGPFSFGFNFPYYWYTINRCWVGSNGYVEFSSGYNFAHPFADIPNAAQPNDYIAALSGDLDLSRGNPSCYFWTNNADSAVVSWINVGEYGFIDSTHTFQLIFSAADSSIKVQYGDNHGRFLDSSDSTMTVIGIENVNGSTGIQYLRRNLPANHMWHSGLALKYHPVPNPSYVVHDFGIVDGFVDGSGAQFIPLNAPYTIRVLSKNFGNQPENNLIVRCQVRRNLTQIYDQRDTIAHLDPAQQQWVEFATPFTPTQDTIFKVTFTSTLTGDQNSNNNSKTVELDSYVLPKTLRYCDNIPETGRSWTGDFSGFGLEFQVPEAVALDTASFFVYSVTAAGPAYVWVMPDSADRPNEHNILAGDTVQVTDTGWVHIDLSYAHMNILANNKFYVVVLHALQNTFQFGMDQTVPLSNRGWEYTGGLSPDRDRGVSDIMFTIHARSGTGIHDEITPKSFSLSQNYPNPFNARTNIRFSLTKPSDVTINIYNIVGQVVQTISGHYNAGDNNVTWDASNVASGVYFYKLNVGDVFETRKMVLLK